MPETLLLEYNLLDLPTAQHRAGLAGLVLVAQTLQRRGMNPLPEIEAVSPTEVSILLAEASLATLLNDIYDATTEEVLAKTRRKDQEPLRIEQVAESDARTGGERHSPRYVYPQVVPRAAPLEALSMPLPWLKLWRDAIWGTVRGVPKTRLPYEQRARGLPLVETGRIWADLKRAARMPALETDLASPLYIGAQAHNAELVPFRGRPAQNLLLHFWQTVAGVGEVWRAEYDRKRDTVDSKPAGYVFAVPDVADVPEFVDEFAASAAQLSTEMLRYRPRDAVLALPAEGGLQLLRQLTLLANARATQGDVRYAVSAIEVYHLVKRGNTIPLLGTAVVPARSDIADGYNAIVAARLRNSFFRAQLINNLLADRPWFSSFGALLDTLDPHLISSTSGGFSADARRKFAAELGATA